MKIKAHILAEPDEPFVAPLRELLSSDVSITVSEQTPGSSDFSILIGGVPTREDFCASDKLTTLVIPWAGLPQPTAKLLKDFPHIVVHNIHHNADATAEMALMLALAAAKKVIPIDRSLRNGDWRPRYNDSSLVSLSGKNALIIGLGHIGKTIAELALALKMNVRGINRSGLSPLPNVTAFKGDKLTELLSDTHCLFIAAPYTNETEGLIGQEALAALPDNAIVVNIARGKIIDQSALFDELKTGRIRAGLDVWYNYPRKIEQQENTPPSDFDFGKLDNVVMMPHMGGDSLDIENLRAEALAELLNSAARGEELPNRVDLIRGY